MSKNIIPKNIKCNIPINFSSLGTEIKISPKSCVSINQSGYKVEFFTNTVEVIIGIGKDHHAVLIMDEDAWGALNNGEEISISTVKDFKKNLFK